MTKNVCYLISSLLMLIISTQSFALVNSLNKKENITLKWKTRIGLTSYRTTLQFADGQIIAPSNGSSRSSSNDKLDGVHLIDGKTGKIKKQIVLGRYGDRDVNGVAISASKLVFGSDEHAIGAFDWKGSLLWVYQAAGDFEGAPALTNLNNDTILDVIAATEAGELLALDGKSGKLLWKLQSGYKMDLSYPKERGFMGSPTVTDIDDDGTSDILIGCRNGTFYAVNGKTGNILWKNFATEPSGILASTFATKKSVFFAESYGYVHKLTTRGRELQRSVLAPGQYPQIVASPMINKKNTLVIGTSFKNERTGFWQLAQYKPQLFKESGKVSATAMVANVDKSPDQEFVLISEDGRLYILDEDGRVKGDYALPSGGEASPLIADVDKDGYLELLLALNDQYLYCYDLPSKGPVYWSQFRANPYNTGVLNDNLEEDAPIPYRPFKNVLYPENSVYNSFNYISWYSEPISPFLISEKGIGHARIGTSLRQFKEKLNKKNAQFKSITLDNGLKAMGVIFNNAIQYYLIFPQHLRITNNSIITMVATNNPNYKTRSGIHSGQSLYKTIESLGKATFYYNPQHPLEERIRFSKQPSWLVFSSYSKVQAGIYTNKKKLSATQEYQPGATLQFISVR